MGVSKVSFTALGLFALLALLPLCKGAEYYYIGTCTDKTTQTTIQQASYFVVPPTGTASVQPNVIGIGNVDLCWGYGGCSLTFPGFATPMCNLACRNGNTYRLRKRAVRPVDNRQCKKICSDSVQGGETVTISLPADKVTDGTLTRLRTTAACYQNPFMELPLYEDGAQKCTY
ncbi:hypothetical protein M427DRAFT_50826, partial [Gonapodya prolifera JEL478]